MGYDTQRQSESNVRKAINTEKTRIETPNVTDTLSHEEEFRIVIEKYLYENPNERTGFTTEEDFTILIGGCIKRMEGLSKEAVEELFMRQISLR